jgi:prolyl-tRNA synthetase family II
LHFVSFSGTGGQKLSMAKLQPSTLWKKTNRWNTTGPELMRLQDRKGEDFCLAPTAEELVTDIVADVVHSYRQLPVMLYQIGEKYRDEMRPRYGLIRGREFLMKDMYSFDITQEAAHSTYERVVGAYHRVMQRFRLPYIVAEADSGNIGGNKSHEFHALAAVGEDTLLTCPKCGQYTANVEKARGRVGRLLSLAEERTRHTITSMDQFLALFDHPERAPMQCTVFVMDDKATEPILVITPHGETVNEYHVKSAFPNNKMTFQPYDQVRNIINKAGHGALRIVFDNSFQAPTGSTKEKPFFSWNTCRRCS